MLRQTLASAFLIAIAASSLLGSACSSPPASPAPASTPKATPATIRGPHLYVTDETGGRVVVINAESGEVAASYAVGKRPRGLRLSPDGTLLFVALSGSPIAGPGVDESKLPPADRAADGIGVVDLKSGQLLRKLKSGQDPESFDVSLDGGTLFVSNEETAETSLVDVSTGYVRSRVKVGEEPEGVTLSPDGKEVFVTAENDAEVFAIDAGSGRVVARIRVGRRPRAVQFTHDGKKAFVSNENDASVSVIDTARHRVSATIRLPQIAGAPMAPRPMGMALSLDGATLFVSLGRARAIAVIAVDSHALVRVIPDVGARPWGIAVSQDGRTLYTANGPSSDVSIVDIASGKVTKRVNTGGSPWGVVFTIRP